VCDERLVTLNMTVSICIDISRYRYKNTNYSLLTRLNVEKIFILNIKKKKFILNIIVMPKFSFSI